MPIKIIRNDITKMECDAIVNAVEQGLLLKHMKLGGFKVGQAKGNFLKSIDVSGA